MIEKQHFCDDCENITCLQFQPNIIEAYLKDIKIATMSGDIDTCYFKQKIDKLTE